MPHKCNTVYQFWFLKHEIPRSLIRIQEFYYSYTIWLLWGNCRSFIPHPQMQQTTNLFFGPELHLQHQPDHYGIYGGQSDNGKVVLRVPPFLPVGIIPPMLHVHISFTHNWCYTLLAAESIVKHTTAQPHHNNLRFLLIDTALCIRWRDTTRNICWTCSFYHTSLDGNSVLNPNRFSREFPTKLLLIT
jgi:hypothetical protein